MILCAALGLVLAQCKGNHPKDQSGRTISSGAAKRKPGRVLLVGGEIYPQPAMKKFVEWAGGKRARILVVMWGGMDHDGGTFNRFSRNIKDFEPAVIRRGVSIKDIVTPEGRAEFLRQMNTSTGIFFTGGDQTTIMQTIMAARLREALNEKYNGGMVFAGNSAGAAMMSRTMLTGDTTNDGIVPDTLVLSKGLGLINSGIVDQHFIERHRQNRLLSALMKSDETWAVGVDEGSAVAVQDERFLEVLGESYAMIFTQTDNRTLLKLNLLPAGKTLDLLTLQPTR